MAEQPIDTHSVEEIAHEPSHIRGPDGTMVMYTWVTFFLLLAILYKFAWKPILSALDAREEAIRKAVEDADKAKEELTRINETRQKLITEAELKARDIIDQSRKAAVEAAKVIQQKAREESQIALQNSMREIKDETEKARAILRQESVDLSIKLAGKIIEANLDDEKNRKLVNQYIKEI